MAARDLLSVHMMESASSLLPRQQHATPRAARPQGLHLLHRTWARQQARMPQHGRLVVHSAMPSDSMLDSDGSMDADDTSTSSSWDSNPGTPGEPTVIMSGVSYSSMDAPTSSSTPSQPSRSANASASDMPPVRSEKSGDKGSASAVGKLKMQLLSYVAGLDRGIAAFPSQQREVDVMAAALERSAARPVKLTYQGDGAMQLLEGRWRLVYSSGFGSGSLGGRYPGPPAAAVPFNVGQVFQDIDNSKMELDNVVQLCFRLPSLPFSPDSEPAVAEIRLGHTFEVMDVNKVTITFETTDVKVSGPGPLSSLPGLAVPQLPEGLRPPKDFRSASFDVSYLDEDMRITRGDRGELRVFVRA